jgi:hypothetical protein
MLRYSVFGLAAMVVALLVLRPTAPTVAVTLWLISFAVPMGAGLVVVARRLGLPVERQIGTWLTSLLPAAAMIMVLSAASMARLLPDAPLPALIATGILGASVSAALSVPIGRRAWRTLMEDAA